jgi:hypothetical protein
MNAKNIEEIARNFLGQHYSVHSITKKTRENGIWFVDALVSAFGEKQ